MIKHNPIRSRLDYYENDRRDTLAEVDGGIFRKLAESIIEGASAVTIARSGRSGLGRWVGLSMWERGSLELARYDRPFRSESS